MSHSYGYVLFVHCLPPPGLCVGLARIKAGEASWARATCWTTHSLEVRELVIVALRARKVVEDVPEGLADGTWVCEGGDRGG